MRQNNGEIIKETPNQKLLYNKKQIDYENEETKYFSNKRIGTCNATTIYN